jgi:hypothetical protein
MDRLHFVVIVVEGPLEESEIARMLTEGPDHVGTYQQLQALRLEEERLDRLALERMLGEGR